MATPQEVKRKKRDDFIIGLKALLLTGVNALLCWLNFTITRLAAIFGTKYYIATIYDKLVAKSQTTSIMGISQFSDMVAIILVIMLCMVFIFWVWHRYEQVLRRKKSIFREFVFLTGWQLSEVSLAALIMLFFNFLLVEGNMDLMTVMFDEYSWELLLGGVCLLLGIGGIVTGFILRKRANGL
ncbi:MAG: hypothetical protein ACOX6S_04885 [Clostridia bacterium]|jgi:hypothetical protein